MHIFSSEFEKIDKKLIKLLKWKGVDGHATSLPVIQDYLDGVVGNPSASVPGVTVTICILSFFVHRWGPGLIN